MGTKKDPLYEKKVREQYDQWVAYSRGHLEQMDKVLPKPRVDLRETLAERGISRREFIKWTSATTALLMLPPLFKPLVAQAAEQFSRLPVVWLHFAECTGCSEAFLRTSYPNVDSVLLDTISLEYHETLMAAAGDQAEQNLQKCLTDFAGKFICVIEGALPQGLDGNYLRLGPKGKTGIEIGKEVASKAAAVVCIGACSSFGNVQAAKPNPTDAAGVGEVLGIRTVNIAGCPPNPINFVGTLLHFLMFGGLPALDGLGRPVWAYGARIHSYCERRPHYDAAEFVEEWGDEGATKGWCLYKMGCKGPYTFANCGKVRFNDAVSWPIMGGHGCMGCTEPAFWDTMAPLEKPIDDKTLGGGEKTVDTIGMALLGATAAGIAAHAGVTAYKHMRQDDRDETSPKE
ncbi:MAG: hydrogenase small subunit [Deltaproteobacteria bacterium]|nr:hydrogenase small subunit [Deltaproteobacteria bacterium]